MKKVRFLFLILSIGLFFSLHAQKSQVTILHTNDTHSQIEPFNDKQLGNVGGVLRRNEIIQQERLKDSTLLLIDAGDFSQGTPYFNVFKGFPEIELMNRMGYDVATLGNHEFDNGFKELVERLKQANFQIVCANYKFKYKPLVALVKPYTIIERNGVKVGIFGLSPDLQGLASPTIIDGIFFQDPIKTAKEMVAILKEEECDLIICVSHLGFKTEYPTQEVCDYSLAEAVGEIDLIIGGHTHTTLTTPQIVNGVRIVQAKNKGTYIGKMVISYE
jgi:5'-nucleotidase